MQASPTYGNGRQEPSGESKGPIMSAEPLRRTGYIVAVKLFNCDNICKAITKAIILQEPLSRGLNGHFALDLGHFLVLREIIPIATLLKWLFLGSST